MRRLDLRVELAEVGIDGGQQRVIVLLAELDHVLEGIEVCLPRDQPRPQVLEIEVVLSAVWKSCEAISAMR